jgi:hypothetical protein
VEVQEIEGGWMTKIITARIAYGVSSYDNIGRFIEGLKKG